MSDHLRERVLEALRVDDVLGHLGIQVKWLGRGWGRARRCAEVDHGSDAFAIDRDGHWKCHSCDKGGDLLALIARAEGIDVRAEFRRVLELGAAIAQVDLDPDDILADRPARPAPKVRPAATAPEKTDAERIALAKTRARWTWTALLDGGNDAYLRSRGLDPEAVERRELLKHTPLRIPRPLEGASSDLRTLWWTHGASRRSTLGIAVPVRAVEDGAFVDVRVRRFEPEPDQPKIVGMVGHVTVLPAARGKTRQLVGCFGHPHAIDSDLVICGEGLMDYLTALAVWPNAQILCSVEAGTLALVAEHAARQLAAHGDGGRLIIIEQADPPRVHKRTGEVIAGAADVAVNEDPNCATKVAVRHLGPRRVGWLYCGGFGAGIKDLNDLVRNGIDPKRLVAMWSDLGPPVTPPGGDAP